jgi:hypothetical protein
VGGGSAFPYLKVSRVFARVWFAFDTTTLITTLLSAFLLVSVSGRRDAGKTLRQVLHESFQPSNKADLNFSELREFAVRVHDLVPPSFDI